MSTRPGGAGCPQRCSLRSHGLAAWVMGAACLATPLAAAGVPAPETARPAARVEAAASLRVLPAGVEGTIEAAFARAGPRLRLDSASISAHGVAGQVCTADGACAAFRLSDVLAGCHDGAAAGPFCLRAEGLGPADAAALRSALAATPDPWRLLTPQRAGPPSPPLYDEASTALHAERLAIAFGLGALPLALGAVGGLILRRWRRPGRRQSLLVASLPTAAFAALSMVWPSLGLWDGLWITIHMGVGLAGGWWRPRHVAVLTACVAVFAAGLVAEGVARVAGPSPRPEPPLRRGPLHVVTAYDADDLGRTLHWSRWACERLRRLDFQGADEAKTAKRPAVVHLGDSMIQGIDVAPADNQIGALRGGAGSNHINAGMPGTSIDVALLAFRRLREVAPPALVVLHVFPANDLLEVGAPLPCCQGAALDLRTDDAMTACAPDADSPPTPGPLGLLLHESPPPYALRALAFASHLAGHAAWAIRVASSRVHLATLPTEDERKEASARAFFALNREVRAAGARLLVVVQPHRPDLAPGADTGTATRAFFRDLARRAGAGWLDLHEAFLANGAGPASDAFRSERPDDIHLTVEGHRRAAALVAAALAADAR